MSHETNWGRCEKMIRSVKKIFCIFLLCLIAIVIPKHSAISTHVGQLIAQNTVNTILLDAGHGGVDSGASSRCGIVEKDINLAIALELQRLAEADGWRVVMTRTEDKMLGDGKGSIRSRKTQDLRARKEIIDRELPLVAVSIHLNSFREDPNVRGAQVFYPAGPGDEGVLEKSKMLAEAIQSERESGIDDGKERTALSKSGVMILNNPKAPTVIVECGFLSNREEARKLADREYQLKLAALIYNGIMRYIRETNEQGVEIVYSGNSFSEVEISSEQPVDKDASIKGVNVEKH